LKEEPVLGDHNFHPRTDKASELQMIKLIDHAKASGDTLGGIVEIIVAGLPPGIGSYTEWSKSLILELLQLR
jgi:chorismate synthase